MREMILHGNFFRNNVTIMKIKFKIVVYSLMELKLKITCRCHQGKIAICCQMPLVAPIALEICAMGFFSMLKPNLQSDLLSDHPSNTSLKYTSLQVTYNNIGIKQKMKLALWLISCRKPSYSMGTNCHRCDITIPRVQPSRSDQIINFTRCQA